MEHTAIHGTANRKICKTILYAARRTHAPQHMRSKEPGRKSDWLKSNIEPFCTLTTITGGECSSLRLKYAQPREMIGCYHRRCCYCNSGWRRAFNAMLSCIPVHTAYRFFCQHKHITDINLFFTVFITATIFIVAFCHYCRTTAIHVVLFVCVPLLVRFFPFTCSLLSQYHFRQ